MSNRDKKKKKKKRREARLRQEKHERKSQPLVVEHVDDGPYSSPFARESEPVRFDDTTHSSGDEEDEGWDLDGDPEDDWTPDLDEIWGNSLGEEGYWGETEDPNDDAFCLPDAFRIDTERAFRHVAKLADGSRRDDWSAAMDFLDERESHDKPPLPADPVERAQELAYRAMVTTNVFEIKRLTEEALTFDPDCVDALSLLAFLNHTDPADRVRELEQIVAIGERTLGGPAFFEAHKGRFFTRVETRPYMRAREYLANVLAQSGRIPEALAHYEAMLDLDPCDHQNLHSLLLCRYLELGRQDDAKRIMERFSYGRPVYLWARVLGFFLTGDRTRASQACLPAIEADDSLNELFYEGDEPKPPSDAPASAFEKPYVLATALYTVWRKHPEAIEWLKDAAQAFTEEEIRQCRESFAPPVAKLLDLGEPKEKVWQNYRKTFHLSDEHIPELIRLLETWALEESEEKDGFAVMHAWRALAQLKAQPAVGPILKRFSVDLDRCAKADFAEVFVLLGPASIPGLQGLLAGSNDPRLRGEAALTLAQVGAEHPDAAPQCVEILMEQLHGYRRNPRSLNTHLADALRSLKAPGVQALIDEIESAGALVQEPDLFDDY